MKSIAIIGGGAAGFFTAINLAHLSQEMASITIYEATAEVLLKVGISGGGRCNLSNSFEGVTLQQAYPRGHKLVKQAFRVFDYRATYNWFEEKGVKLVTQKDNCIFPASQDAQEIKYMLTEEAQKKGVKLQLRHKVVEIKSSPKGGYELLFKEEKLDKVQHDIVVITVGGCKSSMIEILESLGEKVHKPIPSLFGFKVEDKALKSLSGTVLVGASVRLQNNSSSTKVKSEGPILITHQGFSGPAILKLSSYCAPVLNDLDYKFNISINWLNIKEEELKAEFSTIINEHGKKLILNYRPFNLSARLWTEFLHKAEISTERRWAELGSKGINRLVNTITNDSYQVIGRTSHQEEFVTCGGVSASSVDPSTLESKTNPNLYFAGEILDIDAITGGFNLQAAWSTGYLVALSICKKCMSLP